MTQKRIGRPPSPPQSRVASAAKSRSPAVSKTRTPDVATRARPPAIAPAEVAHRATIAFRLRISKGDDIAVGPGKVDLLEAIAATGSITAAAKQLDMSYRRAWLLVDTMNRCFKGPVVAAEAGGMRGGGTALTPLGAEVVLRYRRVEAAAARAGAADLRAFLELLA